MPIAIQKRITRLALLIAVSIVALLIGHDALMALDVHATDHTAGHHTQMGDVAEHCTNPEAVGQLPPHLPIVLTPSFLDFSAQAGCPLLHQGLLSGERQMVLDPTSLRISLQVFLN